jgi:hypothetical protein
MKHALLFFLGGLYGEYAPGEFTTGDTEIAQQRW